MSVRAALSALVLSLVLAAPAAAQDPTPSPSAVPSATPDPADRGRALIILDGSKSMNEDAGDGGTRLDAAKAATTKLLGAIPPETELGLRIYGSELSGVSKARACRDTKLAFPVGPTDRSDLESTIQGLEGTGRTPIGRSLLAAPEDLGPDGKRVVVLISDGGDNCAPPDPCEAAEQVSRQGLDLTVSVVGLQVSSERVRRQLECIAAAGGGSYVTADDADELADQLAALFARALRVYEPSGEPVEGTPQPDGAPLLRANRYLDRLGSDERRYYAVDVPAGNRLVVAPTFVLDRDDEGNGIARARILRPDGQEVDTDFGALRVTNRVASSPVITGVAGEGDVPAGRYVVELSTEASAAFTRPVAVELGIDVTPATELVDFAGAPLEAPEAGRGGDGGGADGGSGGLPIALVVGAAGLLLGLALSLTLVPGRRA